MCAFLMNHIALTYKQSCKKHGRDTHHPKRASIILHIILLGVDGTIEHAHSNAVQETVDADLQAVIKFRPQAPSPLGQSCN